MAILRKSLTVQDALARSSPSSCLYVGSPIHPRDGSTTRVHVCRTPLHVASKSKRSFTESQGEEVRFLIVSDNSGHFPFGVTTMFSIEMPISPIGKKKSSP